MRKHTPTLLLAAAALFAVSPMAHANTKEQQPHISKNDPLYSQKMAVWEAEKALHAAQKARPSKSQDISAAEKKLQEAQKALLDAQKEKGGASSGDKSDSTKKNS